MIWHDAWIMLVTFFIAYVAAKSALNRQEEFHRVDLAGRDCTIQRLEDQLIDARRELNAYKRHAA